MAPDTNYVLRRDSIAAASTGGNGLAGSAPLRRGALERPGQVRDDQEQRQGRQQNCKDDLLHSNLIIAIVMSGRPFGLAGQTSRLPEADTSGLQD